jgi:hypothetical protein
VEIMEVAVRDFTSRKPWPELSWKRYSMLPFPTGNY